MKKSYLNLAFSLLEDFDYVSYIYFITSKLPANNIVHWLTVDVLADGSDDVRYL